MGVDGGPVFDHDPSIPQDFGGRAKESFDPMKTMYGDPDPLGAMKLGEQLKEDRRKKGSGGAAIKDFVEKGVIKVEANKLAKPLAENVTTALGQLLNRHKGEVSPQAQSVMEIGLHSKKMKIRLVPSENPKAKDKLNAVEVVGLDGKVKRFRRINPANLSEDARKLYATKINEAAAQQINMNDEQTDVLREKPHERWQRIIKEGRNTDLWIPVDARAGHTGQYLVTEPDLSHYIRKNLADNMGADQVKLLSDRYGSREKLWQHIYP